MLPQCLITDNALCVHFTVAAEFSVICIGRGDDSVQFMKTNRLDDVLRCCSVACFSDIQFGWRYVLAGKGCVFSLLVGGFPTPLYLRICLYA